MLHFDSTSSPVQSRCDVYFLYWAFRKKICANLRINLMRGKICQNVVISRWKSSQRNADVFTAVQRCLDQEFTPAFVT